MESTDGRAFIKEFYSLAEESHGAIESGMACDGDGKFHEAIKFYQQGLEILDRALEIRCDRPYSVGNFWADVRTQQNKMRKTRKEVAERICNLDRMKKQRLNSMPLDGPPSYEEAISIPLNNGQIYPSVPVVNDVDDAYILLHIPSGVSLYKISNNGLVNLFSQSSCLYILKFSDHRTENESSIFLQVGDWIYPLLPGTSPVLHSSTGAYMFPDALHPGGSVGIVLPADIDPQLKILFETLLSQLTAFLTQGEIEVIKEKGPSSLPEHISSGMVEGSILLSRGLQVGAEKVSSLMSIGSERLRKSLNPSSSAAPIDPRLQKTAEVARNVTGAAVAVSGILVNAVAKGTRALGRYLYPHVQGKGTAAISKVTGLDENSTRDKMGGAMQIAAGAVQGFGNIYLGLEKAAITVAKSVSDNTVKVVNHRYGDQAGLLTENTLTSIGQTALAGKNLSGFGVKGLAKSAVKGAGKGILLEHVDVERKKAGEHQSYAIEALDIEEPTWKADNRVQRRDPSP